MSTEELSLPESLCSRLAETSLAFLAEFLEVETRLHPQNIDALSELGHVYTRLGRHMEGLALDRRLVKLVPGNPTVHYNLACSLSLLGEIDASLESLEASIHLGFRDANHIENDEDLSNLHGEPRFEALLDRVRANA